MQSEDGRSNPKSMFSLLKTSLGISVGSSSSHADAFDGQSATSPPAAVPVSEEPFDRTSLETLRSNTQKIPAYDPRKQVSRRRHNGIVGKLIERNQEQELQEQFDSAMHMIDQQRAEQERQEEKDIEQRRNYETLSLLRHAEQFAAKNNVQMNAAKWCDESGVHTCARYSGQCLLNFQRGDRIELHDLRTNCEATGDVFVCVLTRAVHVCTEKLCDSLHASGNRMCCQLTGRAYSNVQTSYDVMNPRGKLEYNDFGASNIYRKRGEQIRNTTSPDLTVATQEQQRTPIRLPSPSDVQRSGVSSLFALHSSSFVDPHQRAKSAPPMHWSSTTTLLSEGSGGGLRTLAHSGHVSMRTKTPPTTGAGEQKKSKKHTYELQRIAMLRTAQMHATKMLEVIDYGDSNGNSESEIRIEHHGRQYTLTVRNFHNELDLFNASAIVRRQLTQGGARRHNSRPTTTIFEGNMSIFDEITSSTTSSSDNVGALWRSKSTPSLVSSENRGNVYQYSIDGSKNNALRARSGPKSTGVHSPPSPSSSSGQAIALSQYRYQNTQYMTPITILTQEERVRIDTPSTRSGGVSTQGSVRDFCISVSDISRNVELASANASTTGRSPLTRVYYDNLGPFLNAIDREQQQHQVGRKGNRPNMLELVTEVYDRELSSSPSTVGNDNEQDEQDEQQQQRSRNSSASDNDEGDDSTSASVSASLRSLSTSRSKIIRHRKASSDGNETSTPFGQSFSLRAKSHNSLFSMARSDSAVNFSSRANEPSGGAGGNRVRRHGKRVPSRKQKESLHKAFEKGSSRKLTRQSYVDIFHDFFDVMGISTDFLYHCEQYDASSFTLIVYKLKCIVYNRYQIQMLQSWPDDRIYLVKDLFALYERDILPIFFAYQRQMRDREGVEGSSELESATASVGMARRVRSIEINSDAIQQMLALRTQMKKKHRVATNMIFKSIYASKLYHQQRMEMQVSRPRSTRALSTYVKNCKSGKRSFTLLDAWLEFATPLFEDNERPPEKKIQNAEKILTDNVLIDQYANIIVESWQRLVLSPSSLIQSTQSITNTGAFEKHCFAVIYTLGSGFFYTVKLDRKVLRAKARFRSSQLFDRCFPHSSMNINLQLIPKDPMFGSAIVHLTNLGSADLSMPLFSMGTGSAAAATTTTANSSGGASVASVSPSSSSLRSSLSKLHVDSAVFQQTDGVEAWKDRKFLERSAVHNSSAIDLRGLPTLQRKYGLHGAAAAHEPDDATASAAADAQNKSSSDRHQLSARFGSGRGLKMKTFGVDIGADSYRNNSNTAGRIIGNVNSAGSVGRMRTTGASGKPASGADESSSHGGGGTSSTRRADGVRTPSASLNITMNGSGGDRTKFGKKYCRTTCQTMRRSYVAEFEFCKNVFYRTVAHIAEHCETLREHILKDKSTATRRGAAMQDDDRARVMDEDESVIMDEHTQLELDEVEEYKAEQMSSALRSFVAHLSQLECAF